MMKRMENPEPKYGQFEYDLFRETYGLDYKGDSLTQIDSEEKITEFNYEKFIHPEVLETMDTGSDEFKLMLKKMNLNMKTRHERLQAAKEEFKKLMPLLARLDEREKRSLIHMLQSESPESRSLSEMCGNTREEQLAQLSERTNYETKNYYRHKLRTLQFADKKRMPVEETKVRDMLRNQHIFRDKINQECGTYHEQMENQEWKKYAMYGLREAAAGQMAELLDDIELNDEAQKGRAEAELRGSNAQTD
jgi:hypothetical protein